MTAVTTGPGSSGDDEPEQADISLGIPITAAEKAAERLSADPDPKALEVIRAIARDLPTMRSADDPDLSDRLYDLASTVRTLAREESDLDLTAEIADIMRGCARVTAATNPGRPRILHQLALDLDTLFDVTYDRAVAEEAIAACREALAGIADDHSLRTDLLRQLAICLLSLFLVSHEPIVLEEGDELLSQALAVLPADSEERAECLALKSMFLMMLYEFTGESHLLDDAAKTRAAMTASPADYQDEMSKLFASVGFDGEVLRLRHDQTGNPDAIRDAVAAQRSALAELTQEDPDNAFQRYGFMNALLREYERTSDLDLFRCLPPMFMLTRYGLTSQRR